MCVHPTHIRPFPRILKWCPRIIPYLLPPDFRIWGASHLDGQQLAPLTQSLLQLTDAQQKDFDISGTVKQVTSANPFGLQSSQIACIPCDPSFYTGNLDAGQTLDYVVGQDPAAVILYSDSATHCNLSTDASAESFRYVFTLIGYNSTTITALQETFNSPNKTVNIIAMSTINSTGYPGTADPGGGTGNGPNTAMIILYTITGIITALFLGIIITGAVRAHRHPERYGPRRSVGRPRQSRARGIARAMLETIPIVKFNENDGVDAAKRDVEMAHSNDPNHEHSPTNSQENVAGQTIPHETEMETTNQPDDRLTPAPGPRTDVTEAGNFSCPICTDDFIKGQDLRVLPCNHQFHPECVDPWLMNVSGTCPLCRIDLNPAKEGENGEHPEGEIGEHAEETAAEGTAADGSQGRHGHRFTGYLNARRMHHASVEERLVALRRVREANQDQPTDEASRPSRTRLATRLRERFRIRTRAHGVENTSPGESGTTTPTVPAPAHMAPEST
ncbi:uncharacterized protein N7477_008579 [Penicillium maclennaniae]|uniref:uncharacterized protein n=1 Tax=Penicillium maclennaniae TaxID=1343394 RepID=UPI00253FB642|nr:uncharacterized protein N7477_008579 [Penicillium maclennaniae]KAJ5666131.1 hypothetical protein N7477_008579 [Penicillium maclennaniae]